jgi:hypothetical protein
MAKHIEKGNGAPTLTPDHLGQHYIDEDNDIAYVAVGTSSSADWKKQVVEGHSHTKSDVTDFDAGVTASTHAGRTDDPHSVTKAQVGLGSADNTSDVNKPVSTAQPKVDDSEKGAANGVATLGGDSKVPASQLPSYVDDVLEYVNEAAFPGTGETQKIYVALDNNKTFRWGGSSYTEISPSEVTSVAGKSGIITLVKGDVGLGNADNTSDANKPVSTATQSALDGKSATGHGHVAADVSDFDTEVGNHTDVAANTTNRHAHSNKTQLDLVTDGDHDVRSDNPHAVNKSQLGLGSVDNTSDANKPISTATQTALDAKVDDSEKGAASGVATLDAGGKLTASQVPAIAISSTHVVANEAAQLALTVQEGDVAVRSDQKKSYIALNADNVDMDDWEELQTPTDAVQTVNGQSGTVVLDTDDLSEGSVNKYVSAAQKTKLDGIEAAATADQTGTEIKTAYENESNTNAYTDAEKTKLSGVATGAEVNPDVVPQAEAEAGTATTERIWTAQRVKQAIDSLGSSGGKSDINFSYCTTAGDFIEVAATTSYTKLDTFLFRGTTALGSPTFIKGLISSTLTGDLRWRIWDKTNSLQICEGGLTGDITTMSIYDFGTLGNLPSGIAQWELQVKEVPTGSGKSRCHGLIIGF